MKKIISLLSSLTLTTTSLSVISCQKNENEDSKPIFPFPERPIELDKVQELIGYYYDLAMNYADNFQKEDVPRGIEPIDSTNWQNNTITEFIASVSFEFIGYQLGQKGGFRFITPKGNNYVGSEMNRKRFDNNYKIVTDYKLNADWTKTEVTKWYNWTLNHKLKT